MKESDEAVNLSVLVVEDRAHVRLGHYPVRFAELAAGFAAAGCRVATLTARGWCRAGEVDAQLPVLRYGPIATLCAWVAEQLVRNALPSPLQGWLRQFGDWLRVIGMVGAARARRRRLAAPTLVVIVSNHNAPQLAAAAAGPGAWFAYTFDVPRGAKTPMGACRDRALARAAMYAEDRRRRGGGRFIVAAADESLRARWAEHVPSLEVVTAPLAGSGEAHELGGAREQLGFDASTRVALLFGEDHGEKDPDVVFRAFFELSDWELVVAGRVADRAGAPVHYTLLGGFVDEHTRELVYSAADLVVISFAPKYVRNSGTLMDAVTWGVPVVCSDGCAAADLVREYRLGVTFEPGDADSLAAAVRVAPSRIEPDDLARARADLSNRAVAQRVLATLGLCP